MIMGIWGSTLKTAMPRDMTAINTIKESSASPTLGFRGVLGALDIQGALVFACTFFIFFSSIFL
jgi:hypothetical protein